MACICRDGWTNATCRDHGVSDGSDDPVTAAEQRDIDNAWGEPR